MARAVLITGGGGGIGRAIASTFLEDGAQVHVCDLEPPAEAVPGLSFTQADVAKEDDIRRVLSDVADGLGMVDVLINNVGIAGAQRPVEDIGLTAWERVMRVNVGAAFAFSAALLPQMKAAGHGVILNISSVSVATVPANRADYNVSKAALEGLSRTMAREAGPWGVRCNAVRPGMVDNDRMRTIVEHIAAASGRSAAELMEEQLRYVWMRECVAEREVGDLCVFLASERARHITGQVIPVCGGAAWEP